GAVVTSGLDRCRGRRSDRRGEHAADDSLCIARVAEKRGPSTHRSDGRSDPLSRCDLLTRGAGALCRFARAGHVDRGTCMSELYRKWGRSIRREGPHLVIVDEAGEAVEADGVFRTRVLSEDFDLHAPDSAAVERPARQIGAALLAFAPVAKLQSAAPHDGKGEAILEQLAVHEPPNSFRPSYRIRPRRAWFHLRVAPFGVVESDAPAAVALLAPVSRR